MDELARVKRATKKRVTSESEWRAAIKTAVKSNSLRDVGKAAGVSHVRILQIVRE